MMPSTPRSIMRRVSTGSFTVQTSKLVISESLSALQLAFIASHGLLKPEELERLTPSTRDAITSLSARWPSRWAR